MTIRSAIERAIDGGYVYPVHDCSLCDQPAFHKFWYGHGEPTGDAWGDAYTPKGSGYTCKDCDVQIGQEYAGEKVWKRTSDLPQHAGLREREIRKRLSNADILLDPLFWESLGKAMMCKCESHETPEEDRQCRNREYSWNRLVCRTCGLNREDCICPYGMHLPILGYMFFWHRFVDHIAAGKSTEEFFSNLDNRR